MIRTGASRHGRGVFAACRIEPGERILRFVGPVVDFEGTVAKGALEGNVLQVDEDVYLDVEEPGLLVNHSCEPNCGVIEDIVLIALRPIAEGEELTFDYSTTMGDGHWTMECDCETPGCRQVVRDWETLPAELRERYRKLGIVSGYLLRRQAPG